MNEASAATLYKYRDAHGVMLYVGVTTKRSGRATQHSRAAEWWGYTATAEFTHYTTEAEAYEAESQAIVKFRPIFNIQRNMDADELRAIYEASTKALPAREPDEAPPTQEGRPEAPLSGEIRANLARFDISNEDWRTRKRASRLGRAPHRLLFQVGDNRRSHATAIFLVNAETELVVTPKHRCPDGPALLRRQDNRWWIEIPAGRFSGEDLAPR